MRSMLICIRITLGRCDEARCWSDCASLLTSAGGGSTGRVHPEDQRRSGRSSLRFLKASIKPRGHCLLLGVLQGSSHPAFCLEPRRSSFDGTASVPHEHLAVFSPILMRNEPFPAVPGFASFMLQTVSCDGLSRC